MKKTLFILLVATAVTANEANTADVIQNKKLYDGQYASCMKAMKNGEEVGVVTISAKVQSEYCKCFAEQMAKRYDMKLMVNLIKKDLPNLLNSMIEQYTDASMRFCDTKMNLKMIQE